MEEEFVDEVMAALERPDIKEQFARKQYFGHGSTPEEIQAYLAEQVELYGRALRDAGVKPE